MDYEQMNNNKVFLQGIIVREGILSHTYYGENFYEYLLSVARLSDTYDTLPIIISERLITDSLQVGSKIAVKGQFRSYNKLNTENNKNKLLLSVFVRDIVDYDESQNTNTINLIGYICKEPVYRTTPFNREICDILVASNRTYNKSDYIPCITWGRSARFVKNLKVGDKVEILGRVQSREYQKRIDENTLETKTAYEISVQRILLSQKNGYTEKKSIITDSAT